MDLGDEEVVALPVSSGSRQSVNVQLPMAILRNPRPTRSTCTPCAPKTASLLKTAR